MTCFLIDEVKVLGQVTLVLSKSFLGHLLDKIKVFDAEGVDTIVDIACSLYELLTFEILTNEFLVHDLEFSVEWLKILTIALEIYHEFFSSLLFPGPLPMSWLCDFLIDLRTDPVALNQGIRRL